MTQYEQLLAHARAHGYTVAQANAAWRAVGGRLPGSTSARTNPRPGLLGVGLLLAAIWWLHNHWSQAQRNVATAVGPHQPFLPTFPAPAPAPNPPTNLPTSCIRGGLVWTFDPTTNMWHGAPDCQPGQICPHYIVSQSTNPCG